MQIFARSNMVANNLELFILQDFENSGVFDAQWTLEDRHREEDQRLQRFLSEEREKEMKRLDSTLETEKERAASELLAGMDQMSLQKNSRNLMAERERMEDHFRRQRDERMRTIMDKVASEEKARSARMLDRQSQEVLLLIAEKVNIRICKSINNRIAFIPVYNLFQGL